MACGCQGASNSGYVYVATDGAKTTYRTEMEAKAAKVRAGGVGTVKPA